MNNFRRHGVEDELEPAERAAPQSPPQPVDQETGNPKTRKKVFRKPTSRRSTPKITQSVEVHRRYGERGDFEKVTVTLPSDERRTSLEALPPSTGRSWIDSSILPRVAFDLDGERRCVQRAVGQRALLNEVIPWLWLYRRPAEHPRLTAEERKLAAAEAEATDVALPSEGRWRYILHRRETWLLMIGA
jgi:hypothetical protein